MQKYKFILSNASVWRKNIQYGHTIYSLYVFYYSVRMFENADFLGVNECIWLFLTNSSGGQC